MAIIGIDPEEADGVKQYIIAQGDQAKSAVKNIQNSPSRLASWEGKRRRLFDETVVADMHALQQAMDTIDGAARRIQDAITAFVVADLG